ncbi:MAG: prolyl aminopeptidase [Candidatus Dormibacteraeota bacterium]|nr:prolyl aminopeptidase [Candidatus Dormibacteraeota bacterium]
MYPDIEPYDQGRLDVGDGNHMYWEASGNPVGKPAVVLHGGPGSGSAPPWRRYFDPAAYRVILFDQRGCGRSTPRASDPAADLSTNTTGHLLADLERLRRHLGFERWLVCGGSWGATLGLAYAEAHPQRVSELILFSVVTTTRREVDWVIHDMRRFFPAEWARFRDGVPAADREGDLVETYSRLLHDPDPSVHEKAAKDWCDWEDSHVALASNHGPDPRYEDPVFRLGFARLVTHYWTHAAWLEDGQLLREASKLAGIPGAMIQGRLDVSAPPDIAWELAQVWLDSELVLIGDAGHGLGYAATREALITATNHFCSRPKSRFTGPRRENWGPGAPDGDSAPRTGGTAPKGA